MKYVIVAAASLYLLGEFLAEADPIFGSSHPGDEHHHKDGKIKRVLKGAAAGAAANLILGGRRKRALFEEDEKNDEPQRLYWLSQLAFI